MRIDRYEQSSEPKRLTGTLQPHGAQTGLSTRGMFLFGLPFVGVGGWATLSGLKLIPLDESKLHAPHWVLAAFGIVFALGGLLLWRMGWRQFKANRRHTELDRRDPALADYPWDTRGFTPPRWSRAAKACAGLAFFALFLSMFNWWAFFASGPTLLKVIVGIFDVILLLVAWQVGMVIGRTLKFGPSRIEYSQFPCRPGQKLRLRWLVPRGISRIAKGTFTLRCVEEWYEASGSGNDQSRQLVQQQVWGATAHLVQAQEILPGKNEDLDFELPADAPSTSLSSGKTVFWELAVNLDLAGLDFKESYLVPVYRQV